MGQAENVITFENGTLNVPLNPRIPFFPGDVGVLDVMLPAKPADAVLVKARVRKGFGKNAPRAAFQLAAVTAGVRDMIRHVERQLRGQFSFPWREGRQPPREAIAC